MLYGLLLSLHSVFHPDNRRDEHVCNFPVSFLLPLSCMGGVVCAGDVECLLYTRVDFYLVTVMSVI